MQYYIVDAFAEKLFQGNPAGVCILDKWPPDKLMQQIAMENNLSETAFAVKEGPNYHLRWFTPNCEIDLCGHATLAAGYIILRFFETKKSIVHFQTLSGQLTVAKKDDLYEMDFPSYSLTPVDVSDKMAAVIGYKPLEAWQARDLVCVLENEEQVCTANIDLRQAAELEGTLLHITSRGTSSDCVSRSFGPKLGLDEDPVCGSGHCHIAPLWSEKLKKSSILARQASKRGGTLYCTVGKNRTKLSGHAQLYASANLHVL